MSKKSPKNFNELVKKTRMKAVKNIDNCIKKQNKFKNMLERVLK